jgi:hypothetical protein
MPYVTFLSDRFSNTPAPDSINAMLGKDVAEWLRAGLVAAGFEAGEVIAEDYGYGFWLKRSRSHYWITSTQYEPPEGTAPPKWLVGIDYDPGCLWIWRLRARPQPGDQVAIARAVHNLLQAEAAIRQIEWWSDSRQRDTATPEPPETP